MKKKSNYFLVIKDKLIYEINLNSSMPRVSIFVTKKLMFFYITGKQFFYSNFVRIRMVFVSPFHDSWSNIRSFLLRMKQSAKQGTRAAQQSFRHSLSQQNVNKMKPSTFFPFPVWTPRGKGVLNSKKIPEKETLFLQQTSCEVTT